MRPARVAAPPAPLRSMSTSGRSCTSRGVCPVPCVMGTAQRAVLAKCAGLRPSRLRFRAREHGAARPSTQVHWPVGRTFTPMGVAIDQVDAEIGIHPCAW